MVVPLLELPRGALHHIYSFERCLPAFPIDDTSKYLLGGVISAERKAPGACCTISCVRVFDLSAEVVSTIGYQTTSSTYGLTESRLLPTPVSLVLFSYGEASVSSPSRSFWKRSLCSAVVQLHCDPHRLPTRVTRRIVNMILRLKLTGDVTEQWVVRMRLLSARARARSKVPIFT